MPAITRITTSDRRFDLPDGAGSDATHTDLRYSYAVTELHTDSGATGIGLAFLLGDGTDVVCRLAQELAEPLMGRDIETLMADFGRVQRSLADHPRLRWLGPHKGAIALALASVTNACWDLWAKSRGLPAWRLLLDLDPDQLLATVDLSYIEDYLTRTEALALLEQARATRHEREGILVAGYPGYDTSVGWFNYSDDKVREGCRRALAEGFNAMKLKVGSDDPARDLRRARLVREIAGPDIKVMVDANQKWTLPQALRVGLEMSEIDPYWIEEPTHPDDIAAHQTLARALAPVKIAAGEHVPNRVQFKNYIQAAAAHFIQVDAVRVAGVSEFLAVSLMARKAGLPVVPHVGDMGQIHQHLVLANHVALGLPALFLEHIPHLRRHFVHPVQLDSGVYCTPEIPGLSSDLQPG